MYYLLPFKFNIFNGKELLINDLGDYMIVPRGTVQHYVVIIRGRNTVRLYSLNHFGELSPCTTMGDNSYSSK